MLKQFGLILCACGATTGGVWRSVALYRRAKLVASLSKLADAIRDGVNIYAREQMEIYRRFSDSILEKRGFLPRLLQECGERPSGALYRAAYAFFQSNDPGVETKEIFLDFAESFGTLGMADQSKLCDRFSRDIFEIANREEKALWNNIRLSLAAGISAGLGIMILFW